MSQNIRLNKEEIIHYEFDGENLCRHGSKEKSLSTIIVTDVTCKLCLKLLDNKSLSYNRIAGNVKRQEKEIFCDSRDLCQIYFEDSSERMKEFMERENFYERFSKDDYEKYDELLENLLNHDGN